MCIRHAENAEDVSAFTAQLLDVYSAMLFLYEVCVILLYIKLCPHPIRNERRR